MRKDKTSPVRLKFPFISKDSRHLFPHATFYLHPHYTVIIELLKYHRVIKISRVL